MSKRTSLLAAAAALAIAPAVSQAANIVLSYGTFQYTTDGGNTFTTITPGGTAAAPTILVPKGAVVQFNVSATVTSNANGAKGLAYDAAGGTKTQPATLGLAAFGLGFTSSSATNATLDPNNVVVAGVYATNTGGTQDGLGGVTANSISGGFLAATQNSSLAAGQAALGYAGGTAAELFNSLQVDTVNANATATITPLLTPGALAYVSYVSGGTSASNRPSYGNFTAISPVPDTITNLPTLSITIGGQVVTGHSIIALTGTGTTPTDYGSQLTAPAGTATFSPGGATSTAITVTKVGPNSYIPGSATVVAAAGSTQAYVQVNGFTPATDQELYALRLLVGGVAPTQAQIGQIIQDINSQTGTSVVASTVPTSLSAVFPSSIYNILLTANPGVGTSTFLGFDFSQETNVAGVSVSRIAAVPEPATIAGLVLGAGSLLARRRRPQMA